MTSSPLEDATLAQGHIIAFYQQFGEDVAVAYHWFGIFGSRLNPDDGRYDDEGVLLPESRDAMSSRLSYFSRAMDEVLQGNLPTLSDVHQQASNLVDGSDNGTLLTPAARDDLQQNWLSIFSLDALAGIAQHRRTSLQEAASTLQEAAGDLERLATLLANAPDADRHDLAFSVGICLNAAIGKTSNPALHDLHAKFSGMSNDERLTSAAVVVNQMASSLNAASREWERIASSKEFDALLVDENQRQRK